MKPAQRLSLVLVTAPDLMTARTLVRLALDQRLVACGNLVPRLESLYWWQGKIEASSEVLILFKTAAAKLNQLEQLILANHPYETPEIITLPLEKGTPDYLAWIQDSVKAPAKRRRNLPSQG